MLTIAEIKALDHFGLDLLSEIDLTKALEIAVKPMGDPLVVCEDKDVKADSLSLIFSLAAEDYISFLDPPYYVQDSVGLQLTEIAMKLSVLNKYVHHPYVYASRILEITAMSVVVYGPETTLKWATKYDILQKLPKGYTADRELDAFYKLVRLTVLDLIGLTDHSLPDPYTIKQKTLAYLKHQLVVHGPTRTLMEPRFMVGIALWGHILHKIRQRDTTTEDIGEKFSAIDKLLGDMYNFQGIMWARAAFVSVICNR